MSSDELTEIARKTFLIRREDNEFRNISIKEEGGTELHGEGPFPFTFFTSSYLGMDVVYGVLALR